MQCGKDYLIGFSLWTEKLASSSKFNQSLLQFDTFTNSIFLTYNYHKSKLNIMF